MKTRLFTAYRENKFFRMTFKLIGVLLILFLTFFLLNLPITNRNFNIRFYNLTKDMGFDALSQINVNKENTISSARQAFLYNISQIEQLEPPQGIFELVFKFNVGKDSEKKYAYLIAYKKFYDSPYWNYWQELEKLYKKSEVIENNYKKAEKEYNSILYVTARSGQLLNEMQKMNDEIETISKNIEDVYKLQEREYKLFTDHLETIDEKYY